MKAPLAPFLDSDGRLTQMPRKAKTRDLVLERLITHFEHARAYSETEVNTILLGQHTFGDPALLRRELFDAGYFTRTANGRTYHRLLTTVGPISLRHLTKANDQTTVAEALDWVSDYVKLETGSPPTAEDVAAFFDVPPSVTRHDVYTLAVLDAEGAVKGVMAGLRNYPQPGLWFIGFLAIDIRARGQGYGRAVLDWFAAEAKEQGADALRLCVIEDNPRGRAFWEKNGFIQVDETPPWQSGSKTHRRFVFERVI